MSDFKMSKFGKCQPKTEKYLTGNQRISDVGASLGLILSHRHECFLKTDAAQIHGFFNDNKVSPCGISEMCI